MNSIPLSLQRPPMTLYAASLGRRLVHGLMWALLILVVSATPLAAQETEAAWEFAPYRVQVWLQVDPAPSVEAGLVEHVAREIEWQCEQVDLAGWVVTLQTAPSPWAGRMAQGLETLSLPAEREARLAMVEGVDKLFFLRIQPGIETFRVTTREFDLMTDQLGPVHERKCESIPRLARQSYQAIAAAFSPLARIEESDETTAKVRMRAAGLIRTPGPPESGDVPPPTYIKDRDVLLPLIKHTGRLRLDRPEIDRLEWTCLTVESRDEEMLSCKIHSLFRTPLGGRASRRQQRLAIVARPSAATTRVALESKEKEPRPLAGYRVYRVSRDESGKEVPILLGATDWRGEVEVDRSAGDFQILYVKNGERVLGRLPLVVGYDPLVTAPVVSDEVRLRAEGIIQGLQSQFLDLVSRRELMARRIRFRIGEADFEGAQDLIDELRALPTSEQFRLLVDQQRRVVVSRDSREQGKIDAMFSNFEELLSKYVDDGMVNVLDSELRAARDAGGGTADESPAPEGS